MLLAFVLVIGMLPMGAVRVSAADHSYSENLVTFIKAWEGFSATAFWDVSQYSIGYGTQSSDGQTITEAQADAALRAELTKIDAKVNSFAAKNGLNLTQGQHDALVSLSFNCGTQWMDQNGRLRSAVVGQKGGNEFLFAICLWANNGGIPDRGLIQRRLSEANLYFNGTYSKPIPSNYTYVILNANGGVAGTGGEDKMQGYTTSIPTGFLAANPTKAGYVFGGWYTDAIGGTYVGTLDASTAAKTLYAQYGYQVKVTNSYVHVRSEADAGSSLLGTKNSGETMVIVQTKQVGDHLWGRFSGGWVALEYTDYASVAGTNADIGNGTGNGTVIATGTVKCSTYVNVREGAGTNKPVKSSISNGTKVNIYETEMVGSEKWGRISTGWISLAFVSIDSGSTNTGSTNTGNNTSAGEGWADTSTSNTTPSTNTNTDVWAVDGASAPSSNTTTNNNSGSGSDNIIWWTDGEPLPDNLRDPNANTSTNANTGTNTSTGTNTGSSASAAYTEGTVTGSAVHVRLGAGTNYRVISSKSRGEAVKVYETQTVNNVPWGKIDGGWICLNYVSLKSSPSGDPTDAVVATGVVNTKTNLYVREGAGTNYKAVKTLPSGTKISVYEKKTVNGQEWGRIDAKNWVCLAYVKLDSSSGSTTTVIATGVVNVGLNVRSGAGTDYGKVKTLAAGTKVSIYEKKTVYGQEWGRIDDKNWVCLTYVKLDGGSSATTGTGKVISKSGLNVRSKAGTNNAIVGAYASGETVTITEVTKVGTTSWGHTAKGWVCMDYIQITNSTETTGTTNTTVTENTTNSTGTTTNSGSWAQTATTPTSAWA